MRMTQRKKGEQREGIREVGSPWLMKHVVCHELSSLDFIPPVIKRECIRLPEVLNHSPSSVPYPFLRSLVTVFQFKVHEFRILPD